MAQDKQFQETLMKLISASDEIMKVWKASPEAEAGMLVEENAAYVVGDKDNYMSAHKEKGLVFAGKEYHDAFPEDVSYGSGMWRMNTAIALQYGSSAAYPIPALIAEFPLEDLAENIIEMTESVLSVMAAYV